MISSDRPPLPDLPDGIPDDLRAVVTRYAQRAVSEAMAAAPIPQGSGAVHEHYFGALTMEGYKCLCGAIKRGNQIIEAAPPASASTASRDAAILDWLQVNFGKVSMQFFDGERSFYAHAVAGSRPYIRDIVTAAMMENGNA